MLGSVKYKVLFIATFSLLLGAGISFVPLAYADVSFQCDQQECKVTCVDGATSTWDRVHDTDPKGYQNTFCTGHRGVAAIQNADGTVGETPEQTNSDTQKQNYCGGPGEDKRIYTAIDFGCRHAGNALTDMLFAIIRWLSAGVGIVVVASLIIGGIQYSASGGDPQASQAAIKRIQSSVGALILFIFAYAILNYVLPGAFLK